MEKFEAKSPDLILELTTLSGKELTLEPALILNAENVIKIINKWDVLEKKQKEIKGLDSLIKEKKKIQELSPLEIVAEELAMIYPKDKIWFLQNFDFGTLNNILTHVAETVAGIKKNTKDSK